MTVSKIISKLRSSLEAYTEDTSVFQDQYLYELFLEGRATELSRRLDNHNQINPQNYQTFCIGLESALSHECGCLTVGCNVLKSKHKLPRVIIGKTHTSLKVHGLGFNITIDPIQEKDLDFLKHNDIKKNKAFYTIINDYLIIWNNDSLEALQVTALWEDIVEWEDIQYCTETNPCKDVFELDLGLDRSLERVAKKHVYEELNIPLKLQEDVTNNNLNGA